MKDIIILLLVFSTSYITKIYIDNNPLNIEVEEKENIIKVISKTKIDENFLYNKSKKN